MTHSIAAQSTEEGGKEPPDVTLTKEQTLSSKALEQPVSAVNLSNQFISSSDNHRGDVKEIATLKQEDKSVDINCFEKSTSNAVPTTEEPHRKDSFATLFGHISSLQPSSISSSNTWQTVKRKALKFAKFVGPGFLVSVAYIDPGKLKLSFL
jgi:hypothetical protein